MYIVIVHIGLEEKNFEFRDFDNVAAFIHCLLNHESNEFPKMEIQVRKEGNRCVN